MAEINDKVMEMVRKELDKNPDAENAELYEKAKKIDGSIGNLSLRQFHARYPLQVKRQKAQKKGKTGGRRKKRSRKRKAAAGSPGGEASREDIRRVLLRFARDVSAADGKAGMIDILSSLDDYVDDMVKAAGG